MCHGNSDTKPCNINIGILILGRKRPGFDMEWGAEMESRVRTYLKQSDYNFFEPEGKITDDRSLRSAVEACKAAGVNVLVTIQATMADARLAPTLCQLWPHPIILWATPENPEGDMISSCSLVGAHCWASILKQLGHPFEIVYGYPDSADTTTQMDIAAKSVSATKQLQESQLGIIGGQAPGYFAMAADAMAINRGLGTQVQFYTLTEFSEILHGFSDEQVKSDVETVKALGLPHKDTTDEDLPMASRLYLTMRHYMDEEGCDALAIRCWPEMPRIYGQWPYLALVRLAEENKAVSCEGDGDGALTALICEAMGLGPCYLSDWLEHNKETITLWHPGLAPFSMSPAIGEKGGPRIARHFNFPQPAVVESELKADMPVTLCRLWRLGDTYRLTGFEGRTLTPEREFMGTHGVVQLTGKEPDVRFRELCDAGMPHHISAVSGHHVAQLKSFARLTGIQWID